MTTPSKSFRHPGQPRDSEVGWPSDPGEDEASMKPKAIRNQLNDDCDPKIITFRLDDDHALLLKRRAALLDTKPNMLARDFVKLALHGESAQVVLQQRVELLVNLNFQLHLDLAAAVQALLTHAGRVKEADAQTWVDKNLRQECFPSPTP